MRDVSCPTRASWKKPPIPQKEDGENQKREGMLAFTEVGEMPRLLR